MRELNPKLGVAGAAILLHSLFTSTWASADTRSVTYAATGITSTLTPFEIDSSGLSFPKFNPSLGQLDSMKLTITGGMTTTLTLNGTQSGWAQAYTDMYVVVQDSGNHLTSHGLPVNSLPVSVNMPYFLVTNSQINGLKASMNWADLNASAKNQVFGPFSNSDSQSETYTRASNSVVLDEFTGAGNYGTKVFATAASHVANSGGNFAADQVTTATIGGSVTYYYEYSSVPEATTMLLGGMAVMPMLGQRRRQKVA